MFRSEEEFEKMVEKIKVNIEAGPEYRTALRQKMLQVFDEQQNTPRKTPFAVTIPFLRLAGKFAAGFILLAVLAGLIITFFQERAGSGNAFARIVQPILTARTVTYKSYVTMTGLSLKTPIAIDCMFKEPAKYRDTSPVGINVFDFEKKTMLILMPVLKTAMIMKLTKMPPENQTRLQANIFFNVREELQKAKAKQDGDLEFLGKRNLNGKEVIGYRCKALAHFQDMTVWANAETLQPVKIESTMALVKEMKTTIVMTDFKFNVPLDDSLFNMNIPPGYRLQTLQIDASPPTETDLLELFRRWTRATGGKFPSALNFSAISEYTQATHPSPVSNFNFKESTALNDEFQKLFKDDEGLRKKISTLRKQQMETMQRQMKEYKQPHPDRKVIDELRAQDKIVEKELSPLEVRERTISKKRLILLKKMMEASKRESQEMDKTLKQNKPYTFSMSEGLKEMMPISRGLTFVNLLPKESDWHYSGQNAKSTDPKTPIFWYRPKTSKNYRVIYTNLTVEEKQFPPTSRPNK